MRPVATINGRFVFINSGDKEQQLPSTRNIFKHRFVVSASRSKYKHYIQSCVCVCGKVTCFTTKNGNPVTVILLNTFISLNVASPSGRGMQGAHGLDLSNSGTGFKSPLDSWI